MNRLWIGVGLLVVLMLVGVVLLCATHGFYGEITAGLEEAAKAALEENWQEAGKKLQESQKLWNSRRRFLSAVTDHEPVEEMDSLFSQLELYEKRRMSVDFAIVCYNLSHLAEAIEESHNLKWWSVL